MLRSKIICHQGSIASHRCVVCQVNFRKDAVGIIDTLRQTVLQNSFISSVRTYRVALKKGVSQQSFMGMGQVRRSSLSGVM